MTTFRINLENTDIIRSTDYNLHTGHLCEVCESDDCTEMKLIGLKLTINDVVADANDFIHIVQCDDCGNIEFITKDATQLILSKYNLSEDDYINVLNSMQSKIENWLIIR